MAAVSDKLLETCVDRFRVWSEAERTHAQAGIAYVQDRTDRNRWALSDASHALASASRALAEARTRFAAAIEAEIRA